MTECDRIIEQGVLPASFFNEECICDYIVTKERKKIWAIGIDLLFQLDRVCRKHGLHYTLAFGSLLGVVRHNGFIPWDDDIDVFMPRSDYDKLRKLKYEFDAPYFLQFPGDDNDYAFSFAKLRNSNTTGLSWAFRFASFNQGLFVDIFPLDNYCDIDIEANIEKIRTCVAESSAFMRRSNPCPDENDRIKLQRFPKARPIETLIRETDSLLRQFNNMETDYYIAWSILTYQYKHIIYKKGLIDNWIETNFYGRSIYIPCNYKEILRITYNDYMKLPPLEQRGVWHSNNVFEPDIPYKDYLKTFRITDK